jgi:hypothetical protein
MMFLKNKNNQRGQAVLIVLLSLSVVLIIVLYIMSRSVTDISLSNKEEDSMRAFSAAEAGVERALVVGSVGDTQLGDANFSASVTDFGKGQAEVVYPVGIRSGEIATFWFSRPSEPAFTGSQAKICWGIAESASEPPAVEITVFHTVSGAARIARATLDPNTGRTATNKFGVATVSPCTIDGQSFLYQTTINFTSLGQLQFMTVKPLYNTTLATKVGIDVSGSTGTYTLLPSQGKKVNADGSFADANRSIEVYQLYPVAPSVFMNAVYSSTGLSK